MIGPFARYKRRLAASFSALLVLCFSLFICFPAVAELRQFNGPFLAFVVQDQAVLVLSEALPNQGELLSYSLAPDGAAPIAPQSKLISYSLTGSPADSLLIEGQPVRVGKCSRRNYAYAATTRGVYFFELTAGLNISQIDKIDIKANAKIVVSHTCDMIAEYSSDSRMIKIEHRKRGSKIAISSPLGTRTVSFVRDESAVAFLSESLAIRVASLDGHLMEPKLIPHADASVDSLVFLSRSQLIVTGMKVFQINPKVKDSSIKIEVQCYLGSQQCAISSNPARIFHFEQQVSTSINEVNILLTDWPRSSTIFAASRPQSIAVNESGNLLALGYSSSIVVYRNTGVRWQKQQ